MIYAEEGEQSTRNIPTSLVERSAYVLTDAEILQLARSACTIERHYGGPMDIEWAKDGRSGQLFIVQARPETVQSRRGDRLSAHIQDRAEGPKARFRTQHWRGCRCWTGLPHSRSQKYRPLHVSGGVLVTTTTNPDWVPIMRRAAAIVTDRGGRTSHAAIVSRELGVPAIVGTGDATEVLQQEQYVTVSCAEGDEGFVYEGIAEVVTEEMDVTAVPSTRTKIMLNSGQSCSRVSLVAAAGGWGGSCPDGICDCQSGQSASHGACPFRCS